MKENKNKDAKDLQKPVETPLLGQDNSFKARVKRGLPILGGKIKDYLSNIGDDAYNKSFGKEDAPKKRSVKKRTKKHPKQESKKEKSENKHGVVVNVYMNEKEG